MFADLVTNSQLFLIVAVRILAMVETAPLLSAESVPQMAKVALAGFGAFAIYPMVKDGGYPIPDQGLAYAILLAGEALIGVIIGFFLTMVYSVFTFAGQLFSVQMGFGASETYDPLAQIEIPLLGQYLNLVGMLTLLNMSGFRGYFLSGIYRSFQSMRAIDLVLRREQIMEFMLKASGQLFLSSITIAMPIVGTLLLVSVITGLFSRAAPQMNMLTEGFPLSISVAYLTLIASAPFLVEVFGRVVEMSFGSLESLLKGALI